MTRHTTPQDQVQVEQITDAAPPNALPVVWRDTTPAVSQQPVSAPQNLYSVTPGQIMPGGHPHDLPWHMTALLDHEMPAPQPEWVKLLNQYHVPGIAATVVFTAFGWMAHREPMHALMAAGFLTAGTASIVGAWFGHYAHGDEADNHITRGLGALGVAAISGGAAVGAGPTGISFMLATALAIGAVVGTHFYREHKRHQKLALAVGYHAAVNPAGKVQIVGGGPLTPTPGPGYNLSHEESLVRKAFEGMRIQLADVYGFKRINESSFTVTAVLAPAASVSPDAVIARKDVLRNALGANQVVVQKTPRGHELRLTVRYGEIDDLAEAIPFPGIVARSIKDPVPLGPDATGQLTTLDMDGNHTVIGGTTNNGKSGLVNVITVSVAGMDDAVLVLIDRKPGRPELGIYEPVAYAHADSFEKSALILEALVAVIQARGGRFEELRNETQKSVRKWNTADGPAIVGVLDEIAELFRGTKRVDTRKYKNPVLKRAVENMSDNYVTIMQVGRAYGVSLVVATQKPDALASGGVKSGTDQAQNRLCVATTGPRLTNIVLRDGAHGDGFRASELDTPGKFLMITLSESVPIERKAYWLSDDQIAELIAELADRQPEMDEKSDAAFQAILAGREPEQTTPPPFGGPPPGRPEHDSVADQPRLYAVPEYPDHTAVDTKHRAVWDAFRGMGSATIDELKALQLDGHQSRESCKTALLVFVAHKGAVSEADGRSERFQCLVQPARRKEA